ncbi:MAG: hypothetical protein RLZZ558_1658 [Planctomycetota bacterium]|jgi:hypothetical protein
MGMQVNSPRPWWQHVLVATGSLCVGVLIARAMGF